MLKRVLVAAIFASPLFASALTVGEIQAQIQQLLQQIAALESQLPTQTATTSTGPYCPTITRTLSFGSKDATTNGEVSELQKFLAGHFDLNTAGIVTGGFYYVTEEYVKKFQAEKGLPQVGVVGPLTRAAIAAACSGTGYPQSSHYTQAGYYTQTDTASCRFNGQTIVHGSSVLAYESSNVANAACRPEVRYCNNGTLSGSYAHATCTVTSTYAQGTYYSQATYYSQGSYYTSQSSITVTSPQPGADVSAPGVLQIAWTSQNAPYGSSVTVIIQTASGAEVYRNWRLNPNPSSPLGFTFIAGTVSGNYKLVAILNDVNGGTLARSEVSFAVIAQQ